MYEWGISGSLSRRHRENKGRMMRIETDFCKFSLQRYENICKYAKKAVILYAFLLKADS